MTQIHEDFKFFRYHIDGTMGYAAHLNSALTNVSAAFTGVSPRSISIMAEPSEITFSIGYNGEEPGKIDFTVFRLGTEADTLVALGKRMEETAMESAELSGDVICHDIFRMPGDTDTLWVLFMVRKAAQ